MFKDRKFGSAANRISVEECLKGQELSIFVVTDGENYKILNSAQDHKRIFDNDEGPNTGGMGAYCPSPLFDEKLREKVENRVIKPTINGMRKEGYPYKGFLYIGIMLVEGEPYMIEYNVRLGDPEAQVIIPMLDNDFLSVVEHTIDEKIDLLDIKNKDGFTVTVILASDGYPDKYEKNKEIFGLDNSTLIFHSGTKYEDDTYYTNGGRVLSVIGSGDTLKSAIDNAYYNVKKIKFQNMYFRNDIGIKGLNFLKKY